MATEVRGMRNEWQADLFCPKVVPDMAMMEMLKKKIESFSYTPQDGFHRDKFQGRRVPLAPYTPPHWLFAQKEGV